MDYIVVTGDGMWNAYVIPVYARDAVTVVPEHDILRVTHILDPKYVRREVKTVWGKEYNVLFFVHYRLISGFEKRVAEDPEVLRLLGAYDAYVLRLLERRDR
jgi:hypothetical protein